MPRTSSTSLANADDGVAARFIDALQQTVEAIAQHPDAGSPRFAEVARMPGLRARAVAGFPYLAFSIRTRDDVRLLRILHVRRDLPAVLADPTAGVG